MIKKLSDTWRQQKHSSYTNKDDTKKHQRKKYLRERAITVTSSLMRTSDDNSKEQQLVKSDNNVIISPPQKTSKADELALFGISSLDWGASDSILNQMNAFNGNNKENVSMGKQKFTQVSSKKTRDVNLLCSPTPFVKPDVMVNNNSSTPLSVTDKLVAIVEDRKDTNHKSTESKISRKDIPCETDFPKSSSPPHSLLDESLSLSNWSLPECVLNTYKEKGIEKMFAWQQECLLKGSVMEGGNLVYSAPTSAGKTLVAEILMLKRVLETKKKALYILPFVSVTREKMYSLRDQFEEAGVKVGGFMGNESPPGGFNAVDIAVCTIEKANSLVNKLMEVKSLSTLSCVIVDEMHMIGDPGRGYLLELLLTKIRFVSSGHLSNDGQSPIQLIGMSATLPNLSMLSSWLNADLYFTNFRPVPLNERIKVGASLFEQDTREVAKVEDLGPIQGDTEGIVPLCVETILERNSVLIFCPTKNWCEKLSETIASYLSSNAHLLDKKSHCFRKASEVKDNNTSPVDGVLDQLRRSPVGLDKTLEKVVKYGVAFHHAGLTYDERDIVEGAFRRGVLRVLVATSTLSSGVNLPARRVIIRSPIFHGKIIDSLVYKQMVGRAGRKGVDERGESILVCKATEKKKAFNLLNSHLKPVYSCLLDVTSGKNDLKSMKRALLEVIVAGVAVTPEDVERYAKCTYLHTCLSVMEKCDANGAIQATIKFLLENEFISLRNANKKQDIECEPEKYFSTQLGAATLASSLSPDEALVVFSELQKARKSFVLENELHVIYQITPIYLQDQWPDLDWYTYYNIWERLPQQFKYVGEMVGVQESFLAKAIRNRIQTRTVVQLQSLRVHRRFYAALALQDLVNEVPLPIVSRRYKINRGLLQSLQNSSATFAGMVTVFCQKLGWTCLELLLDQFQSRLSFGVSRELCNLVRISLLNGFKARAIYESGYQTVSALAYCNKDDIAKILRDSAPFESKHTTKNMSNKNSRYIWLTGKEGLTEHEAAELIITEAKRILAADAAALGIPMERIAEVASSSCAINRRNSSLSGSSGKRKCSRSFVNISAKRKKKSNKKNSIKSKLKEENSHEKDDTKNESKEAFKDSKQPVKRCSPEEIIQKHKSADLISDKEDSFVLLDGSDCLINSPVATSDSKSGDHKAKVMGDNKEKHQSILFVKEHAGIPVEAVKEEGAAIAQDVSNDSMLFSPGSLLKPRSQNSTPSANEKMNTSSGSLFEFSLRLSASDESAMIEENIVPPIKLETVFDEASSQISNQVGRNDGIAVSNADNMLDGISLTDSLLMTHDISIVGNAKPVNTEKGMLPIAQKSKNVDVSLCKENASMLDEFIIVDVASSKDLFTTFLQEWKSQKSFSFSFACESPPKSSNICVIGRKSKTKAPEMHSKKEYSYENDKFRVVGIAVCWEQKDSYYLNLEPNPPMEVDLDDTSLPPNIASELSLSYRVNALKSVFNQDMTNQQLVSFDMKNQLKLLFEFVSTLLPNACLRDPKVANWMLNPDDKQKNIHALVKQYLSEDFIALGEAAGGGFGTHGLGLVPQSPGTGRVRACVEVVLCHHLMNALQKRLINEHLFRPFLQVEMPSIRSLTALEINGIGFSNCECERLKDTMKGKLESIERECYQLANRSFSLTSTDDIAKVLFYDLGLPPNGDVNAPLPPRQTRSKAGWKINHFSTSKQILEKLKKYHRLPKLILEWRRVNSALTKVVYPLQRKKVNILSMEMDRIYPEAQYHTSTGRVTFSEPNIQNVPKEFNIKLPMFIGESPPVEQKTSRKKRVHNKSLVTSAVRVFTRPTHNPVITSPGEVFTVSMRSTFVPFETAVLIAADYSQLELRLISHLSSDAKLIKILNSTADVFKSVAAEIHRTTTDHVTPSQRQHAKQICYGIIYGMGAKALGEQLNVSEEDAALYMQQFKDRYCGVKAYVKKTIEETRKNGYVTTLTGRKRYLSAINSGNMQAKAQAERQAVNTIVQGSAADLVKNAMNTINQKLAMMFGHCCIRKGRNFSEQRGAFFVLQLHDELMYEVHRKDVQAVKDVIRFEMENSFKLSVKLPVKMKLGTNWGNLKDI